MPMGLDETLRNLTGEHLGWLDSPVVDTGLGVATAVELGGFYIPWLDSLFSRRKEKPQDIGTDSEERAGAS